jgi:hypothetical protein
MMAVSAAALLKEVIILLYGILRKHYSLYLSKSLIYERFF